MRLISQPKKIIYYLVSLSIALLHIVIYIKENKGDFTGCCPTKVEHRITKLQKLYSPPRNFRAGNKSPVPFLEKPLCMGDLLPAREIFIERPPGRSTKVSRLKNVEKRQAPPLPIFSTKLLQLNQLRKLEVQTTRKTNASANGAQKNGMMRTETNGSFVITAVISITCNARSCSARKINIMILISISIYERYVTFFCEQIELRVTP